MGKGTERKKDERPREREVIGIQRERKREGTRLPEKRGDSDPDERAEPRVEWVLVRPGRE